MGEQLAASSRGSPRFAAAAAAATRDAPAAPSDPCSTVACPPADSGEVPADGAAPATGADGASRLSLNVSAMPGVLLVGPNSKLHLESMELADVAERTAYVYSAAQPWRNAALGFGIWPSLALSPGAQVRAAPAVGRAVLQAAAAHALLLPWPRSCAETMRA